MPGDMDMDLSLMEAVDRGACWGQRTAQWRMRWSDAVEIETSSAEIVRYAAQARPGDGRTLAKLRWTFCEDLLVEIRLYPIAGRAALPALLDAVGISAGSLREEPDGLASLERRRTRVDVDRLEGYISLMEVHE